MQALLMIARHGRAEGMHPEASLTPEGEAAVRARAERLAAEGWRPDVACVSPYRRAQQTMRILLLALAPGIEPLVVSELVPDTEPHDALNALRQRGLGEGRMLVVSHMPLVAGLTRQLTTDEVGFAPGQMVEIALDPGARHGQRVRTLAPDS